ncbi:hypothetical protein CBA19CS22_18035 [Caballeronia novacaledonica]|uniref:Uncharacterized protein n=1 Tax=Caballeronia novacaledonica TaxID=1544861 RepID=A0ACB5QTH2_9BURK|nr:hypothetical protein CBA19CS22_18035 [Caballeronia novacaledonica]
METDFSKGDLYIVPFCNHIPCSIPISHVIGKVVNYYSGCECDIVSTGNASLSFQPDADFLQSIHSQCAVHSIQRGRTPNYYTIGILPRLTKTTLDIFTFTYYAKQKGHVECRCNPVAPSNFLSAILYSWQQIVQMTELPHDAAFDAKMEDPHSDYRTLLREAGAMAGVSFAQIGGFEAARTVWTSLIDEYGYDQPEILLNIGQSYSDQGNFEEAVEWLDMSIGRAESDKEKSLAFYNRGLARANMQETGQAIADFQECLRLAPEFSLAYNSIGACHMETGSWSEARRWFEACVSLPQSSSDTGRQTAISIARENLKRIERL